MKQRKKFSLTTQYVLIFGALLLIANILLGIVLMNQSKSALNAMLQKNMLDISNTAAGLLDGDALGALTADDVGGPVFTEIADTLAVFKKNVDIEYIYTVRQVDETQFVFVVDPDPVNPGQFGEKIVFTHALGQAARGIAAADDTPAADYWGNFYTAYSPVFDSAGRVAGIVGVDFGAAWYEDQIHRNSVSVAIISVLTVLFGAVIVMLITNRTRKRFRDLERELSALSADVDELTDVITSSPGYQKSMEDAGAEVPDSTQDAADEIVALSEKIRAMEHNMQRYLAYIHVQTNTDAITGVGNTTAYLERKRALDGQIAGGSADYAIAVFDVDRLKQVNDIHGHACGDMFIRGAADAIAGVFGKDNTFRIGGDEFLVIAERTTEAGMAEKLALVETAAGEFSDLEDYGISLSLSGGTAFFRPGEDSTFQEVFVRADEAMYRNKGEHHRCSV